MVNLVDIKNLKFTYPGASSAVLDIESFQIKAGEKVFLQGPSGSGKSTLLNLIGGVLQPNNGEIEVLGKNLNQLSPLERDQFRGDHMGFIFQMFNLLPYFSAIDNITLPCEFSNIKHKNVLEHSGSLEEEAIRLLKELKLNPEVLADKKINQLSVGQQQRVAVARALMGRPKVIIADEPTSALDSNIRDSFINLLFHECNKFEISLVFVSHDLGLGKHFDRVESLQKINRAAPSDQIEQEFSL